LRAGPVTTRRHTPSVVARLAAVLMVLAALFGSSAASLAVAPAATGEPGSASFLSVQIDSVTPDTVTTGSTPMLTVTGTIANTGDRAVRDIVARLERAPAVSSSAQLRSELTGDTSQYQPVAEFITVATQLDRGQRAGFTLNYPLRSADQPALGIDGPGVYPLLVNVNGTPDYGAAARLDDARFLLPVLGVPTATPAAADVPESVIPPDTTRPVPVTMLWPLADQPRLAPGVPGGTSPVRLMDDSLATSLGTGGRLDTLLGAAEFATSPPVDPNGDVGRALCLAIDPDLLVTVNAMTSGYTVSDSADGLGTASHPGTGQAAASAWLDRLRALAGRMCVIATPYAQTDLDALARDGDPALSNFAIAGSADLVEQLLGVPITRGVTVIGDEPLNQRVADLLDAHGPTVALAAAEPTAAESESGPAGPDLAVRRLSGTVVTTPFDPSVGAALAGLGNAPREPSYLDPELAVPLSHDSPIARRQDAVSAMVWRALTPAAEPREELLIPPMTWSLRAEDAQAVLSTLATSIQSGLAVPRPLSTVIATAAADPTVPQPASASANDNNRGAFDDAVVGTINAQIGRLWGLTSALTTNQQTGLTGLAYTAPLREDMLRALSQAAPVDTRNAQALARLAIVGRTIDDLFGAVTIVNPGGSYTLATEHSPLPLALRNDLAVPIRVRLDVAAPPGMTVTDIGDQELPPGYLPIRVPIEVHFTQRVAVDVALRTPDGLPLGEPVRLSVHSNAYGKVLFFITVSAGAVLALLTGRRLWHRFRGQPDRADLDRPRRSEP